jgi:hypothetical protein
MPIITIVPLLATLQNASPLLSTIYNTLYPLLAIAYRLQQYIVIYKSLLSSALSLSIIPYQLPPHVVVNILIFQRLPFGYTFLLSFFFKCKNNMVGGNNLCILLN